MGESFRFGEVFARSLKVLIANFVPFVLITALVQIPLILYSLYFARGLREVDPADVERYAMVGSFVMLGLTVFLGPIATGAVTFGTVQYLRGKTTSVGECISVGISRLLPVLGVGFVTGLAILGGLIACVIPGIIAICMLFVAVPAAVIERLGVGASLRRSGELTKGYRWPIFGIVFLLGVFEQGSDKLLEIAILKDAASFFTYTVATLAAGIVLAAWQASAAAVSYYYLRSTKESVDIEEIAAVFD